MNKITNIIKFLLESPLNREHKLSSVFKFIAWQLKNLVHQPIRNVDWIDSSKFAVRKGETALTGNIYAGLIEFEDMCFCFHVMRAEDMFLDIGANIGSYTIIAGKVVGAEVVSFEPVPSTYRALMTQVGLNQIESKVTAHNMGVSDKPGKIHFTTDLGAMNHAILESEADQGAGVEVATVALDDLIEIDRQTVLKIDVEGFELHVLKGARSVLANDQIVAIIIEMNGNGQAFGISDSEIHAFLTDLGYFPVSYDPFTRTVKVEQSFDVKDNTLYIRDLELVRHRCLTAPKRKIHTAFGQMI